MSSSFRSLLFNDNGHHIAEYAGVVAVVLIIVVGTICLIFRVLSRAILPKKD
jgi:Flp pilus assembly pilin Flp